MNPNLCPLCFGYGELYIACQFGHLAFTIDACFHCLGKGHLVASINKKLPFEDREVRKAKNEAVNNYMRRIPRKGFASRFTKQ